MKVSKNICICSEKDLTNTETLTQAQYEEKIKNLSGRAKLMTMFSHQKSSHPKIDFFETSDPDYYLASGSKNLSSVLKDKSKHRVNTPNTKRETRNLKYARKD
jgi:hypothetical protein